MESNEDERKERHCREAFEWDDVVLNYYHNTFYIILFTVALYNPIYIRQR